MTGATAGCAIIPSAVIDGERPRYGGAVATAGSPQRSRN